MKNKFLAAMGIGITTAFGSIALSEVDAKADVDPYDEELARVKRENAETVSENNEIIEENQEIQEENEVLSSVEYLSDFNDLHNENEDIIADQPSECVDDTSEFDLNAEEVEDAAAALDDINEALEEANQKLADAEEALEKADGNNVSGYNALVDAANEAAEEYNDILSESEDAAATLKDKVDAYNASAEELEERINTNLDKKAVKDAQEDNEAALLDDENTTKENAETCADNADTLIDNTDDLNKAEQDSSSWEKSLYDSNSGEKYTDLLINAKNTIDSTKADMDSKKGALDSKKAELDEARAALDKITPAAGETKTDAYNAALDEYQSLKDEYNALVEEYNGYKEKYDAATDAYSTTLANYAEAQNKFLLENGVSAAQNDNNNLTSFDTKDDLTANDGKKISDIDNEFTTDAAKVLAKDADTVNTVATDINALKDAEDDLKTKADALTLAENTLNLAIEDLKSADPKTISEDAYNALVKAVEDAQNEYKSKVDAYNGSVSEYNDAAKDLVDSYNDYLQAVYDKKVADINDATKSANEDIIGRSAANGAEATGNMKTFDENDQVMGQNASELDVNTTGGQLADLKKLYDNADFTSTSKDSLWNDVTSKASSVDAAKSALDAAKSDVDGAKVALLAGDPASDAYTGLVKAYNDAVASYNDILSTYNEDVEKYNRAAEDFVDDYNDWCDTQRGLYSDEEKKVITPIQALKEAQKDAESASMITNVDPNTIAGTNANAIAEFKQQIKDKYGATVSDKEIEDIFTKLYQGKINDLESALGKKGENGSTGTGVIGAWEKLGTAAADLNEKVAVLNAANDAVDAAASNDNLTKAEFEQLKSAYNQAADAYNEAVETYKAARDDYKTAIAAYNAISEDIADFEFSVFDNEISIKNVADDIAADSENFAKNLEMLGLSKTDSADKIWSILGDSARVEKQYSNDEKTKIMSAISMFQKGENNTVNVDGKDYTINDLREALTKAAVEDENFDEYNKLIKGYNSFIAKYNDAKDTLNGAFANYIGELVSQYTDAEKKDSWDLYNYYYNTKQGKSNHVDVKLDGAVSLNDEKTAVRNDAKYQIVGVYATEEDAKNTYNTRNYGNNWTGEYNGRTRTGSLSLDKIDNEFSFNYDFGKQIRLDGQNSVGVKISSCTFYVKYIDPQNKEQIEKFTITSNDRFKENSWYCGEHADYLDNVKDSKGQPLEWREIVDKYGNRTKYYNISGYSVFEISKRVCQDGSGLDLVLSIEVLQAIRDSKTFDPINGVGGSLQTVNIYDDKDINLNPLEISPDADPVKKIDNDVYENKYKDPGEDEADPEDLLGLTKVNGVVKTSNLDDVTKDSKTDPVMLADLDDPSLKSNFKKVNVDPVSGEVVFDDLAALKGLKNPELTKAEFDPISLKTYVFTYTKGEEVSPFNKLKPLPVRPVTPPGENPPEDPPTVPPTVPPTTPPTVVPPVPEEDLDVLGASRGPAVLGARRSMAPAVLGKRRRPTTGDSMVMFELIAALAATSAGAAATAVALKKSKDDDAE